VGRNDDEVGEGPGSRHPDARVSDQLSAVAGAREQGLRRRPSVRHEPYHLATVALVGESGSGKSTTAYCILRLEDVTAGSVFVQGQDITHLPARFLRPVRRDMNVIFQDPLAALTPWMTIGDIITEPLVVHGIGDPASRRARMHELLDRVGLRPDTAARKAHELSGGQGQRVGIARALAL